MGCRPKTWLTVNLEKEDHLNSGYARLASRTTLVIPLLLAAALLALAGCGGSQEVQGSEDEQGSQEEESTTSAQGGADATAQTVAATEVFLGTLDDAQREQASFDF